MQDERCYSDTFISQVLTPKEIENYCTTLELGNLVSLPASYRQLIKTPAFHSFPGETEVLLKCKKTECQRSRKASKPDRDTAHSDLLAPLLQSLSPRMRRIHHAMLPPPQPASEPQPIRTAPRLGGTGGGTLFQVVLSGVFPAGIPREKGGSVAIRHLPREKRRCFRAAPAIPDTDPPHPASRPAL